MNAKNTKELKRISVKLKGLFESLEAVYVDEYYGLNKMIDSSGAVSATLVNESNRMDEACDRLDGCIDSLNDALGDK